MAKFEIALHGGILTAKSIQELIRKIEAESEFWAVFGSVTHQSISQHFYGNPWIVQTVNYLQEVAKFWPSHFVAAKEIVQGDTESFQRFKLQIEGAALIPPFSSSRVATLARRLFDAKKVLESVALLAGASGLPFAQLGTLQNQVVDQAAYISFGRSLAAVSDLDLESGGNVQAFIRASNDAKVIESLSNDLGLLFADASSARDAFFKKTEFASTTFFGKLNRLRESEIKYFKGARREEKQRRQENTEEFKALFEAFNAHLRLKRPVELWKERGEEHQVASSQAWRKFFWGAIVLAFAAVLVAFFLGGIIAESFIVPGCVSGTEPMCTRISARGPLNISLLLVVTTTWLWYLRLQMRIFLSERHLTLDARERMAFAETYLSLLKGAEVTREHETVVLQSLMRPTQDGIIKDESGPDFALSSLLAKALERR
jgi:hypothetical protein